jgi:DNA repair protein RadC
MAASEAMENGPVLTCGSDAAALLEPRFSGRGRAERIEVAHLCSAGRVLGFTHGEGCRTGAELPARAILHAALEWNSAALVIAHNHPSGDPTPSRDDLDATCRFAATARMLGIRVIDHIIFAGSDWRSFRALGLL